MGMLMFNACPTYRRLITRTNGGEVVQILGEAERFEVSAGPDRTIRFVAPGVDVVLIDGRIRYAAGGRLVYSGLLPGGERAEIELSSG